MAVSLSWTGLVSVSMRWAREAAVAVVEQDGLADAGELAQQFADGHPQSGAGGAKAHEADNLEG